MNDFCTLLLDYEQLTFCLSLVSAGILTKSQTLADCDLTKEIELSTSHLVLARYFYSYPALAHARKV